MRRLVLLLAVALAFALAEGVASAKSVQQEFSQAWTERGERYEAEQLRLNARADEAWKALDEAMKSNTPDVKDRTGQFITALQDGAYNYGRAMLLDAFKEHLAKKPSAAATELWMQERVDALRTQAEALDRAGERLANDDSPGAFKAKFSALATSAKFFGTVAELKLLDENLGSYFKAKSVQDDGRRRARAAFFGALAGAARAYDTQPSFPRTTTCQSSGNAVTCTGN